MIEAALTAHLRGQAELAGLLAVYGGEPAVFGQEAPPDRDPLWGDGPQYARVVFAVDIQGDPARTMGGQLAVDVICREDGPFPEELEPLLRQLIHGWFFSAGAFTAAAQWKSSNYFTQPEDHVVGVTMAFDLLAFPVLTTEAPDIVDRLNQWSAGLEGLLAINRDPLPSPAWRPTEETSAVYWRLVSDEPARWVKESFQTVWRTATVRGHVFAPDPGAALRLCRRITAGLYAAKRLPREDGEAPILVNTGNRTDPGADPLKTGQLTVEGTYGVVVHHQPDEVFRHLHYR